MADEDKRECSPSWYLPAHIARWRAQGDGAQGTTQQRTLDDIVTQIIVMNHPEAVAIQETIDTSLFASFLQEEEGGNVVTASQNIMGDVMAAITSLNPNSDVRVGGESSDLIDQFLELKDLRIVAANDEEAQSAESEWAAATLDDQLTFEEELVNEELADIYLKQGLFDEAKEIYSRLFLLYSEKSVYFAGLIDKIDKKQLNS